MLPRFVSARRFRSTLMHNCWGIFLRPICDVKPDFSQLARATIERCRTLAQFSEDTNALRRTFLCPAMHDVHRELADWLISTGAETHVDSVGNFHALYSGETSEAPRLLIGSHLDTVPNAGAFDGVLGVVLPIALLEALNGRRLPFAIEVIGFSEEEGVRFRTPFLGSRALAGVFDEQTLDLRDGNQISVREAIRNFGINPEDIGEATLRPNSLAFLEFHIEQGPILESLNLPLAAVESICGQSRFVLTFTGQTNHAGTTPMALRRDAMAAAAEWIVSVEARARATEGLVATVGSVQTKPGTGNVIAGEVVATLDVRHRDPLVRDTSLLAMLRDAYDISQRRGVLQASQEVMDQSAVQLDAFLTDQIEQAIVKTGCTAHRMASGAGHDAMILAEKIPAAMIFLRTPGGISHDPAENVLPEDVAKAIECGLHLLDQLAAKPEFYSAQLHPRTSRA